ncbi:MAG: dihydrodipicolinate reductase [Archangium sp.]|nr:dihydrodipicolinate reductase [Archangium sp.]
MGLGAIGQEIARAALRSEELELIGAVDSNPKLAGRALSTVLGVDMTPVKIQSSLAAAAQKRRGAVVLHATGSKLPEVKKQVLEAIGLGLHVVSTCEELAFPWLHHADDADAIDAAAQKHGVSVVGTGVNPGFVLDRLIAMLGQVCGEVRHVKATRVVDARTRREALQRKVGAGLTEDEFFALVDGDGLGHVGLVESAALAALGLGLDCDDFEEELRPVFAEEDITGGAFPVKRGRVAGIHQVATALTEGREVVRLELTIAVGADEPGDTIELEGNPPLRVHIPGGIQGDQATANLVIHAAPRVTAAGNGLLTVLDLPAGR